MSIDQLGGDVPTTDGLPNQMVQHPPLYYLTGAVVMNLPGFSSLAHDQQFALLRLLSAAMIIPIPLITWKAATEALGGDGWLAKSAAVVPLSLPNLARTGASFNNDSLLILLGSIFTLLLVRILKGDVRRRTAWLLGLVLLTAALTKAFGVLLAPVAILAYLIAWLRSDSPFPYRPLVIVAVVGCALGSLWWFRNILVHGTLQPFGYGVPVSTLLGAPRPPDGTLVDFVVGFFLRLGARFYGGIGLPEAPTFSLQLAVIWVVTLLALSTLGALVPRDARRRRGLVTAHNGARQGSPVLGRLGVVVLLLPGIVALVVVMAQAYRMWSGYGGVFPGVQGRYLYHAVAPLAIAAMIGISALPLCRFHRWLPLAMVLAAIATQLYAWRLLVESWWVPPRARGELLDEMVRAWAGLTSWSAWPDVVTATTLTIPFVAAAGLIVAAAKLAFDDGQLSPSNRR